MEKIVDLRGLVCPEPVLRAKKLLDDATVQSIDALVESEVNLNNLRRLAKSMKVQFSSNAESDYYKVTLTKGDASASNKSQGHGSAKPAAGQASASNSAAPVATSTQTIASSAQTQDAALAAKSSEALLTGSEVGTVVFLSKDKFGDGDQEFSNNLLNMFLQTLLQSGHRPRAILMANTGVKVMDPDASTYKVLCDFMEAGVEVLACGLCVDYYGLKGKIPVERITNMFAICEFLMVADKVIQP